MSASEFEGHEEIVAALTAGKLDAPEHLRRRVLAAGPGAKGARVPMSPRRRFLLVLPVAATLAVGAAVVHGAFFAGSSATNGADARLLPLHIGNRPGGSVTGPKGPTGAAGATGANGATGHIGATGHNGATASGTPAYPLPNAAGSALTSKTAHRSAAFEEYQASGAPVSPQKSLSSLNTIAIPKGRLVHATAYLSVGVANTNALTQATNNATQIVTSLGGFTQSSQIDSSHFGSGTAFLDLRVPLAHTETAIERLGRLGHILSQSVSTKDLEQQAQKETSQIGQLQRTIVIYKQALATGTLSPTQRIDIQIKLSNAEHQIAGTRKQHSKTVKAGTTAEIKMSLSTTHHGGAAGHHKTGKLGQMLHNIGTFLGIEGLVVLYALVIVLPIALVAALIWWLTRGRRQRDERRLLAAETA